MKRILVIAEDVRCFQELSTKLQTDDASIIYASSLQDGLEMYQTQEFNMAFLISSTQPGKLDGHIPATPGPQNTKLLIIAPIDTADDNMLDFLLGRVPKPCVQGAENGTISIGSLLIEPEYHRVTKHGQRIWLTPKEFDILYLLAQNYGRVLSKLQIYNSVWVHDEAFNIDNTVSCHIQALRRKLGPAQDSDTPEIHTTWGVGISLIIKPERARPAETRQELATKVETYLLSIKKVHQAHCPCAACGHRQRKFKSFGYQPPHELGYHLRRGIFCPRALWQWREREPIRQMKTHRPRPRKAESTPLQNQSAALAPKVGTGLPLRLLNARQKCLKRCTAQSRA